MALLHSVASLAAACVLLSSFEYAGHRWVLHKMRLARRLKSDTMKVLCINHMAHHGKPYRHPEHERDDNPWELLAAGLLIGLVVSLPVYFFIDPLTVKMLVGVGSVYAAVTYFFHKEMHLRSGCWYAGNAVFRYLDRRHERHHAHPDTNFNVILPFFDWPMGTAADTAHAPAQPGATAN